jgi:hypothetical protein
MAIACAGERARPNASTDSVSTDSATVGAPMSCDGLEYNILRADITRASMRERYGAPDSIVATTEANRHVPGLTDSLFAVHYAGLTAHIRTPPSNRDLGTEVHVSDNRYLRHPEIGIGVGPATLVNVLGQPTRSDTTSLVYECGDGAEQPVTFHLAQNVVHRIEIRYYVD